MYLVFLFKPYFMQILSKEVYFNEDDSEEDLEEITDRLNRERVAMNNSWLFERVQEGLLSQKMYTQILIMKDTLNHVYPDMWDIQVKLKKGQIRITALDDSRELPTLLPYGFSDYVRSTESDYTNSGERYNRDYSYLTDHFVDYYLDNVQRQRESVEHHIIQSFSFYDYGIVIRFPQVTLTNSNEKSCTVKELYVRLNINAIQNSNSRSRESFVSEEIDTEHRYFVRCVFDEINTYHDLYVNIDHQISSKFEGIRMSQDRREIYKGYLHSHLPSRNYIRGNEIQWNNFCLGTGEIFQTLLVLNAEFSPELFGMFLHQLYQYLSWESLEGGPHIRMDCLPIQGYCYEDFPDLNESYVQSYINKHKETIKSLKILNEELFFSIANLDWKVTNHSLQIVNNSKFNEFCKLYGIDYTDYPVRDSIFNQGEDGKLYSFIDTNIESNLQRVSLGHKENLSIVFKGEDVLFEVTESPLVTEQRDTSLDVAVVHPNIKNSLKLKLEANANYEKIRENISTRANQALLK